MRECIAKSLLSIALYAGSGGCDGAGARLGYQGDYTRTVVLDFQDGMDCGSTPYVQVTALYSE
jgi:hypothetical protein